MDVIGNCQNVSSGTDKASISINTHGIGKPFQSTRTELESFNQSTIDK
jgi:hypothetical protein